MACSDGRGRPLHALDGAGEQGRALAQFQRHVHAGGTLLGDLVLVGGEHVAPGLHGVVVGADAGRAAGRRGSGRCRPGHADFVPFRAARLVPLQGHAELVVPVADHVRLDAHHLADQPLHRQRAVIDARGGQLDRDARAVGEAAGGLRIHRGGEAALAGGGRGEAAHLARQQGDGPTRREPVRRPGAERAVDAGDDGRRVDGAGAVEVGVEQRHGRVAGEAGVRRVGAEQAHRGRPAPGQQVDAAGLLAGAGHEAVHRGEVEAAHGAVAAVRGAPARIHGAAGGGFEPFRHDPAVPRRTGDGGDPAQRGGELGRVVHGGGPARRRTAPPGRPAPGRPGAAPPTRPRTSRPPGSTMAARRRRTTRPRNPARCARGRPGVQATRVRSGAAARSAGITPGAPARPSRRTPVTPAPAQRPRWRAHHAPRPARSTTPRCCAALPWRGSRACEPAAEPGAGAKGAASPANSAARLDSGMSSISARPWRRHRSAVSPSHFSPSAAAEGRVPRSSEAGANRSALAPGAQGGGTSTRSKPSEAARASEVAAATHPDRPGRAGRCSGCADARRPRRRRDDRRG